MLSKQLKESPFIDIKTNIISYAQHIKSKREKDLLLTTIFNKPLGHHVVYLSFQYEWLIKPDYMIVTDALARLSTVKTQLSLIDFQEKNSLFIREHMSFIFSILKDGLIAYGCNRPPYKADSLLNSATILDITHQVLRFMLIPKQESQDDLFKMEI